MSHAEQIAFFRMIASLNAHRISGANILEIGSFDVNGTVRDVFSSAGQYLGLDLVSGPGVDLVADGRTFHDGTPYDIVISGESFEHDPYWRDTLENMARRTRPGGLVIFTCASRGRVEHGTRRTEAGQSPGTQALGSDYYRNVLVSNIHALPLAEWFVDWRTYECRSNCDVFFVGERLGPDPSSVHFPHSLDVARISEIMPARQKLLRLPLRALASTSVDEDVFQNVAVAYWSMVTSVIARTRTVRLALRGRRSKTLDAGPRAVSFSGESVPDSPTHWHQRR